MEESLRQKIRSDFDRIALSDQAGWNHNNHYHRFLIKQLPSHCKTALGIGCGTGDFARLLARRAETVVAIDLSSNMIEVAKQRSNQFANIDFQVADVLQQDFRAETFDVIRPCIMYPLNVCCPISKLR